MQLHTNDFTPFQTRNFSIRVNNHRQSERLFRFRPQAASAFGRLAGGRAYR
jgi:hypothetical protein